jgi:hypothetical protein
VPRFGGAERGIGLATERVTDDAMELSNAFGQCGGAGLQDVRRANLVDPALSNRRNI